MVLRGTAALVVVLRGADPKVIGTRGSLQLATLHKMLHLYLNVGAANGPKQVMLPVFIFFFWESLA